MLTADGDLSIRLMADSASDYEIMASWLSDPRVLEYYEGRDKPSDAAAIRNHYSPRVLGNDRVTPCIIERDGRPIGYVQVYPLDSETLVEYEMAESEIAFGFDIFIGEADLWGLGLGTRSVSLCLRHLFDVGAAVVTADPRVNNPRALRVYEKAGMKIVKRLPAHEFHEGEWHDNWLMSVRPE